jgi:hypothetical protein
MYFFYKKKKIVENINFNLIINNNDNIRKNMLTWQIILTFFI